MKLLLFSVLIICGILSGIASYKKFSIKKQLICIFPLITAVFVLLYYYEFGLSAEFLAGSLLIPAYLFFSAGDIKTRRVSNVMHILVFAAGFVFLSKERLFMMLLGAVILGVIPLVTAVIKPGTFGGADIKFLAAAGWLFGLESGILLIVSGLLLSILSTAVLSIIKRKKIKRIPMIPYFTLAASIIFSTL